MNTSHRKISVVMCTYNGAKHIKEQLDSILNQTYPIAELIIQDDRSTDNTAEICREYADKYPFIDFSINEKQKGINLNFYTAFQRATGDYIAISDQDDIWKSNKIELQIQNVGDCMLSASLSHAFTDTESVEIYAENIRKPNYGLERMIYTTVFPGHTMMFRKDFLCRIPEFNLWGDKMLYDKILQFVAAAYESISFNSERLVRQRRHINAATYSKPLNYERSLRNIIDAVLRTFQNYRLVRPHIKQYFLTVYTFLEAIETDTQSKSNAMKISRYQSQGGIISFIKLTYWNVRLRDKIFYSTETSKLFGIMRACYFSIACSDYFRHFRHYKK